MEEDCSRCNKIGLIRGVLDTERNSCKGEGGEVYIIWWEGRRLKHTDSTALTGLHWVGCKDKQTYVRTMTGFSWWPLVTATGLDCSRGSDRDDTITLEWDFTVWGPAWYSLEIIANTQLTKLWWRDERDVLSSVLSSVVDWRDWLLTSLCWGRGGRRVDGWQSEEVSLSSGSAPALATGSGWASPHLQQHATSTFIGSFFFATK